MSETRINDTLDALPISEANKASAIDGTELLAAFKSGGLVSVTASQLGTKTNVFGGDELPADAHPEAVFILEKLHDGNQPGIYYRNSEDAGAKTSFWTANVVFAANAHDGVKWSRTDHLGKETGLPDEVLSIFIDAAGETMTLLADTDAALLDGPGDLNIEIEEIDGPYSFTVDLTQQGSIRYHPELRWLTFRGTVMPGIVAGKAYKLSLTTSNNNYWTPHRSLWNKIALTASAAAQDGQDGAPGADGADGDSPIPAVVEDGQRRVLQIVDWYPLTGAEYQVLSADGDDTATLPTDTGWSPFIDVAPVITSRTSDAGKLDVAVRGTAKFERSTHADGVNSVWVQAQVSITSKAGVERTVAITPNVQGAWGASNRTLDLDIQFSKSDIAIAEGETAKVQIRANRAGNPGNDVTEVKIGNLTSVEWTVPGAPPVRKYIGEDGFVDAIADAVDIRGQTGQTGGSAQGAVLHFASDAEARTGTNTTKVISPHSLKVVVDGRVPTDSHINDLSNARIAAEVEKAARNNQALSDGDKKAFRDRIGAEKAGRVDYISQNLGGYNYFGSPRRTTAEDTGVNIPAGATRLLVSPLNDGNYAEVDVATLLALPDVSSGDETTGSNSINLFDESDFRLAHRGRDIYFVNASVQGPRETADFIAHLPKLEPYADRATPNVEIPTSRLPSGVVNVKPDWRAAESDAAGILHKPVIPTDSPASWATEGNTDRIPSGKLPETHETTTARWAQVGNTDLIPIDKIPNIPASKLPTSLRTESGHALPANPSAGDRFILLVEQSNVPDAAAVLPIAVAAGVNVSLPLKGRPTTVTLFEYRNAGTVPSSGARKLNIQTLKTATKAYVDGTEYDLRPVDGDFLSNVITNPLTTTAVHHINVKFSDGTFWFPPRDLAPGEYYWTGHIWMRL